MFVGHADLSPGANHIEPSKHHVPVCQRALQNLGATVASDLSGGLREDRIHWAGSEHTAVNRLIKQVILSHCLSGLRVSLQADGFTNKHNLDCIKQDVKFATDS